MKKIDLKTELNNLIVSKTKKIERLKKQLKTLKTELKILELLKDLVR